MATNAVPTKDGGNNSKAAGDRKHGIFRSPALHRWLRTFHRAAALIAGIFMAVIGITGALVSFEMLLGEEGGRAHVGQGVFGSTVHFTLMDLHTFFIFGKGPGLAVEILVTTALILFAVSGLWFYAVLFRQWLKLAIRENGGYSPSIAFRAANRFMAKVAVVLIAVVVILAIISIVDYFVSRPASMAARAAHLPPPPPSLANATKLFFALKADVILMAAASVAIIYFCVVGFWYSGLVFSAWRGSKAARAGQPAQPGKAMRTIHRFISVPFGLYLVVMAASGVQAIPGLWTAHLIPWLHSANHARNLKIEAIVARNKTLPPDQQIPLPPTRQPGGAQPGGAQPGGGQRVEGQRGGEQRGQSQRAEGARAGGQQGGGGANAAARNGNRGPLYGRIQGFLAEDIHNGKAFGKAGQIFVMLTGLALAMFSLSGIWMYVSMYFQRRASGRKRLIWH